MSTRFSLNTKDLIKLGKNAALVGLAAGLTYIGENITSIDLGTSGILIVPLVALFLDSVISWVRNNEVE